MKVDDVFTSFKQLHDWYQHKNTNLNNVKRADKNPLGDLYYPKKGLSDEAFSIHDYEMLHSNHPHNNKKNILKDINYPEYTKRYLKKIINDPASLLIGDLEYSFLWKTPIIRFKGDNAPRHGKWSNIKSFLCHLEPAVDVMLPGNVRIDSSKDR